jgi:hypothetical protein
LPPAIVSREEVQGSILGNILETREEALKRLPLVMDGMESVIETNQRLTQYQAELKAIPQLGLTFRDWQELAPVGEAFTEQTNLMYIIPSKTLAT